MPLSHLPSDVRETIAVHRILAPTRVLNYDPHLCNPAYLSQYRRTVADLLPRISQELRASSGAQGNQADAVE